MQRYFSKTEDQQQSPAKTKSENSSTVIEFDVSEHKLKQWGRRREDAREQKYKKKKTGLSKSKNGVHKKSENILDTGAGLRPKKGGKKKFQIPKKWLEKHSKGEGVNLKKIETKIHKKKLEEKEKQIKFASEIAAISEVSVH